jgi:glucose-1-phosphate thymidylyltransferase
MTTKGIILAGGYGTRLFPITKMYSKQLIAVFDKPMLYYPLNTLIIAGIKDILIISNTETLILYQQLLGDGKSAGLNISYAVQDKPNGIAEAFIIAEDFIGIDNVCLILGDNIFYGADYVFYDAINQSKAMQSTNHIFALYVSEPQRYGVVKFDDNKHPIEIIEKPTKFISNYAIPGFYIYDCNVVNIAKSLKPSNRNELEITDINNILLKDNKLEITILDRTVTWLDCGTPQSLLSASNFIASAEERYGKKFGCYEETAYKKGFISRKQLLSICEALPISQYTEYLMNIANDPQEIIEF